MPRDFAYPDQIAVCRRHEHLFRGVEIFGAQRLLHNGDARLGRDFKENPSRHSLEASGAERRRINLAILHRENISGSAFGHFAALIEQHNLIEALFDGFRNSPDIWQPGDALDSRERRGGMATLRAQGQTQRLAELRERGGVNDQVNLWVLLATLPEADLVIDQIHAPAA